MVLIRNYANYIGQEMYLNERRENVSLCMETAENEKKKLKSFVENATCEQQCKMEEET